MKNLLRLQSVTDIHLVYLVTRVVDFALALWENCASICCCTTQHLLMTSTNQVAAMPTVWQSMQSLGSFMVWIHINFNIIFLECKWHNRECYCRFRTVRREMGSQLL